MSRTLQFKRYANTTVASTTGANGELIIDLTNQTITVHNGSKVGGTRLATESYVANTINAFSAYANSDLLLTQAAFNKSNTASNTAISAFTKANSANILAQSAYGRANDSPNIFIGTNSFAVAPLGSLYFGSNTGIDIVGTTGSILYINSPQNLRTNGTPTFANVTTQNLKFSGGGSILGNVAQNQITLTSNAISDLSGFTAYGSSIAQIYANTFIQLVANTGGVVTSVWNFNTDGSITFPDNTIQRTSAEVGFAKANVANTTAEAGFSKANLANVLAQSAFTQANSANILAQAAFNTANNVSNGRTQSAQSTTYTLQSSDAGKYFYYTHSANVILYLPWTSNVSFANGTTIMIYSQNTAALANVTVTPNVNVSLFTAGNTLSGSHNVNPYGVATLTMVKANTWFMTGFGIN